MSCRMFSFVGAAAALLTVAAFDPVPAFAQGDVPRTPWGHPDLQGIWDHRTITPLERPEELGDRVFLTEEEAAGLEQAAVDRAVHLLTRPPERTTAGGSVDSRADGTPGFYNDFWLDTGTNTIGTRRTSLIIDPPNGRLPALTDSGSRRIEKNRAYRREHPNASRSANSRMIRVWFAPLWVRAAATASSTNDTESSVPAVNGGQKINNPLHNQSFAFLITKTACFMIVNHPDGLHMRVNDGATNKLESSLFEGFRQRIRLPGCHWQLFHGCPAILYRLAINEIPDIAVEAAKFHLYGQECLCVTHRRSDFEPVSDNRRVGQELLDLRIVVTGNLVRFEVVECLTVTIALFQNCLPA